MSWCYRVANHSHRSSNSWKNVLLLDRFNMFWCRNAEEHKEELPWPGWLKLMHNYGFCHDWCNTHGVEKIHKMSLLEMWDQKKILLVAGSNGRWTCLTIAISEVNHVWHLEKDFGCTTSFNSLGKKLPRECGWRQFNMIYCYEMNSRLEAIATFTMCPALEPTKIGRLYR